MAKTAEFLIQKLSQTKIILARVRFVPPNNIQANQDLSQFYHTSVLLDVGLPKMKWVSCSYSDRELELKIIHQYNPRFKRFVLKPKSVRAAMDKLLAEIRERSDKAIQEAPTNGLYGKAMVLIEKRATRRRSEEHARGVEMIRTALIGPAKDMELEDLVELWRSCCVEVVMSS